MANSKRNEKFQKQLSWKIRLFEGGKKQKNVFFGFTVIFFHLFCITYDYIREEFQFARIREKTHLAPKVLCNFGFIISPSLHASMYNNISCYYALLWFWLLFEGISTDLTTTQIQIIFLRWRSLINIATFNVILRSFTRDVREFTITDLKNFIPWYINYLSVNLALKCFKCELKKDVNSTGIIQIFSFLQSKKKAQAQICYMLGYQR